MMLQKEIKMTDEMEYVFSAVTEGSIQLATLKAIMESEEPDKVEKLMVSYGSQFTKDIVKRMIPLHSKSISLLENVIKQKIEKATFHKE
ncbi:hypothetical protein JCM21738_5583 [Mesobacillus boroniphilus JCM 21738]|uniref:Uncharacterized protein n=2 Tax=Mesobacillus boroniphilus TaxID=308892 RepID=W4RVY9_9BACI|nr:hypothetical protein JCM21738_5583 [Mesobacillus boroniphilus JCM 21738]